jgi:hypothetical protein
MPEEISTTEESRPLPQEDGADSSWVGQKLQESGPRVLRTWRGLVFGRDTRRTQRVRLLDGVIEPLTVAVGRSLSEGPKQPTWAWTQTPGLLRLSATRSLDELEEEIRLFGKALGATLDSLGASGEILVQVRQILEACQGLALGEMRRLRDPEAPAPAVGFGGVIVEIFESRATIH